MAPAGASRPPPGNGAGPAARQSTPPIGRAWRRGSQARSTCCRWVDRTKCEVLLTDVPTLPATSAFKCPDDCSWGIERRAGDAGRERGAGEEEQETSADPKEETARIVDAAEPSRVTAQQAGEMADPTEPSAVTAWGTPKDGPTAESPSWMTARPEEEHAPGSLGAARVRQRLRLPEGAADYVGAMCKAAPQWLALRQPDRLVAHWMVAGVGVPVREELVTTQLRVTYKAITRRQAGIPAPDRLGRQVGGRRRDVREPRDHREAGPRRPGTHASSRGMEPYRRYAKGTFAGSTRRSGAGRGLHVRGEAAHGDANPVAVCCSRPLNWRPLSSHLEDVKARTLIRTEEKWDGDRHVAMEQSPRT